MQILKKIVVKASAMNDPQVDHAVQQTEMELQKRESNLMERHQDILTHGKATLELKQDLARQQVKGKWSKITLVVMQKKFVIRKISSKSILTMVSSFTIS